MLTRTAVRRARRADIPFIMDLLNANDLLIKGLDWSDIGDTWWVAVHRDEIVGCVQVLLGKPLGVIAFLAVDLKFHNSGLGLQLLKTAEILLGAAGCDGFLATTHKENIINRAEALGITNIGQVNVGVKRVFRYDYGTQQNSYKH